MMTMIMMRVILLMMMTMMIMMMQMMMMMNLAFSAHPSLSAQPPPEVVPGFRYVINKKNGYFTVRPTVIIDRPPPLYGQVFVIFLGQKGKKGASNFTECLWSGQGGLCPPYDPLFY